MQTAKVGEAHGDSLLASSHDADWKTPPKVPSRTLRALAGSLVGLIALPGMSRERKARDTSLGTLSLARQRLGACQAVPIDGGCTSPAMTERAEEARWSMRKQSKRGKETKERDKKEEKPDKSLGAMIKNTFKGKKRKDGGSSESFSDLESVRASSSFSIPVVQSPSGPEQAAMSPRGLLDPHGDYAVVQPDSSSTPRHDSLPAAALLGKSVSPGMRSAMDHSLSDSEYSQDSVLPTSLTKGAGSKVACATTEKHHTSRCLWRGVDASLLEKKM
jgi:hypothetical protein